MHTPYIDRLAARSARYPNGYVPMSLCRSSLATMLAGLYPHQHGIHFNHPPVFLPTRELLTIYPGFVSLTEIEESSGKSTARNTGLSDRSRGRIPP